MMYSTEYLPIIFLVVIGIVIAVSFVMISRYIGPYRPNKLKLIPYESGMDPIGKASKRHTIGFYLIAMEFIIFDVEIVFIYPAAVILDSLSLQAFICVMAFILILFVGLVYMYRSGALDWLYVTKKSSNL